MFIGSPLWFTIGGAPPEAPRAAPREARLQVASASGHPGSFQRISKGFFKKKIFKSCSFDEKNDFHSYTFFEKKNSDFCRPQKWPRTATFTPMVQYMKVKG